MNSTQKGLFAKSFRGQALCFCPFPVSLFLPTFLLASGAIDCASAVQDNLFEAGSTRVTSLSAPAVDHEVVLEGAHIAVGVVVVPDGASALLDGQKQQAHEFDVQTFFVLHAQAVGGASRVYSGSKERFVCVDIANARNDVLVHEDTLDGSLAAYGFGEGILSHAQRLRPKLLPGRPLFQSLPVSQEDAPEGAHVIEYYATPILCCRLPCPCPKLHDTALTQRVYLPGLAASLSRIAPS